MHSVGAYEAKTHLPHLLVRVAQGETIVITKHGVPIARLVPYDAVPNEVRPNAIKQLLALRTGNKASEQLQSWVQEGSL